MLRLSIRCREINFGFCRSASPFQFRQFDDHVPGFVDSRFGFRGARLRASTQPLDFGVNAVRECVLVFSLCVEVRILRFQKTAVVSLNAEQAVRINAMKFDNFQRDILQQVPIVADNDAGERCALQHRFEPLDSRKIEVIGGFIEQQNFRLLNQSFDNGQTFLPATGQGSGRYRHVREPGAAADFGAVRGVIRVMNAGAVQSLFNDRTHGLAWRKLGVLCDETHPRPFANRKITAVGFNAAG